MVDYNWWNKEGKYKWCMLRITLTSKWYEEVYHSQLINFLHDTGQSDSVGKIFRITPDATQWCDYTSNYPHLSLVKWECPI